MLESYDVSLVRNTLIIIYLKSIRLVKEVNLYGVCLINVWLSLEKEKGRV